MLTKINKQLSPAARPVVSEKAESGKRAGMIRFTFSLALIDTVFLFLCSLLKQLEYVQLVSGHLAGRLETWTWRLLGSSCENNPYLAGNFAPVSSEISSS